MTSSDNEDAGAASGWSIADTRISRPWSSSSWSTSVDSLQIEVNGTEKEKLPSISIARSSNTAATITENTGMDFRVTADAAPAADLSVSLTVADAPNADFIDSHAEGSRTVTIKAGKTSEIFSVWARGDQVDEPSEDVKVTVAGGTGYTVSSSAGSATVKVNDDDATRVSLTTPDATATEGSSTETASVVLTLGRPLRAGESLQVPLGFSGGAVGTDFTLSLSGSPTGVALSGGTVTFTGSTSGSATVATMLLSASQDIDTTDETVTVSIPSSSTGSGTTLTATGLEGGATGSRSGNGQIVLSDDDGTPPRPSPRDSRPRRGIRRSLCHGRSPSQVVTSAATSSGRRQVVAATVVGRLSPAAVPAP